MDFRQNKETIWEEINMKEKSLSSKRKDLINEMDTRLMMGKDVSYHALLKKIEEQECEAVMGSIKEIEILSMSNDYKVCGKCIDIIRRKFGKELSKC